MPNKGTRKNRSERLRVESSRVNEVEGRINTNAQSKSKFIYELVDAAANSRKTSVLQDFSHGIFVNNAGVETGGDISLKPFDAVEPDTDFGLSFPYDDSRSQRFQEKVQFSFIY